LPSADHRYREELIEIHRRDEAGNGTAARPSRWAPLRGDEPPAATEPWLLIDIHDSDITTVTYRPTGPGTGIAYLGYTPRSYFERDDASEPTDVAREAAGLASWWCQVRGATAGRMELKRSELAAFLAHDLDPSELDDDLHDAEVFVEIKTRRFLAALDLPVPDELPR
jgi:hypothetical protein